jgi:hypothetical protein
MSLMPWVKIEKWCNETGDTMDAVHSRRKAGKWLDGQQCKVVDGRLWVNISLAMEWVEKWPQHNKGTKALN